MAEALLSPPPWFSSPNHACLPKLFRNTPNRRNYRLRSNIKLSSCVPSKPSSENGLCRRDLMFLGLSSSLIITFPSPGCRAEEELKMASVVDDINAYSYLYPVELQSKKFVIKWVESRKPERYSSAAPLSPNARLRIVSERVDFIDNLIISVAVTSIKLSSCNCPMVTFIIPFILVQIGPPNSQFLRLKDRSKWNAKAVADSVLSEKSPLRVTASQRMTESSVLDAHSSEIDGVPYWYYEYLLRKSPTNAIQEPSSYRHFVSSTAERDGYLYTLSASTLNNKWNVMGPLLEKTVSSFRLLPPTVNYVPPFKDPWRFW
ncbi:psbP domain-containing protein 5, chloroplastic isoform X2 [Malania oleifera]|uniref:psbP domain-containing protein 5, chloroplastic isoform X2 n=1 Tax=Malania oleifera TaxID=397392 RepID=UPI0025ADDE2E|nr:psbP domain-containing protein 5, chloroplastic isoform X2 [Malania oleifera]